MKQNKGLKLFHTMIVIDPDSSHFYCPLINEKIVVNIKDDGDVLEFLVL